MNSAGEWLFRQGELVLGPVSADAIIQKLYSGELETKTLVSKLGDGTFRRIGEIDVFKVHVAKAEAKARVDKLAQTEAQQSAKSRNIKLGVATGAALVVAVVVGVVAYRFAINNPWKDVDTEAFGDIQISIEPGQIGLARAHHEDEELMDYPIAGQKRPAGTQVAKRDKPEGEEKPQGTKLASAKVPSKANKTNDESDEPDGLQTAKFDQSSINSVVAKNQKTLYPCLVAEAQKNPGLSAKIPIEFVIGNDGKVAKVWVDHPSFKSGSLPECLLQKLQAWKFGAYDGERATVSLSFKIGKNG